GGVSEELEGFRPHQFFHFRFFHGMVLTNFSACPRSQILGSNSGDAASRHWDGSVFHLYLVSISFCRARPAEAFSLEYLCSVSFADNPPCNPRTQIWVYRAVDCVCLQ